MAQIDLKVGARARCRDGECGKLAKLVIDPHTKRINEVILEKGALLKEDRVLPASSIESATPEEIRLSLEARDLEEYPEYREEEYVVPAGEERIADQYGPMARYVTARAGRYGVGFPDPVVPRVKDTRVTIEEGTAAGAAVIGRGTPVNNADGKVGEVDHVLLDRESGRISHIVVDRGTIGRPVVVPIKQVERLSEEAIFIAGDNQELRRMTCYVPREGEDLLAELRDRLTAAECELPEEPIVEEGAVRFRGVVPDVETKRRTEAVARSIEGVVDVENYLDTDTAIMARVIAALQEDSRTDTAVIDVSSDRGTVTLSGKVDSAETRSTAVEVAKRQPGVGMVVNELEVRPDQESDLIRYRDSFYDTWPLFGPRT